MLFQLLLESKSRCEFVTPLADSIYHLYIYSLRYCQRSAFSLKSAKVFFFFSGRRFFFLCYYLPFAEERRSLTSSSTRISRRTKCSVCQSNKTLCKNWLRIIRLSGRAWNTLPRPSNRCSYPSPAHEDKRPFT